MIRTALVALALSACTDVYPERPEVEPAIAGAIHSDPSLHHFVHAALIAGDDNDVMTQLASDGSYTLFAPTNAAFDRLAVELTGDPRAVAADVLILDNQALLREVVHYHLVDGALGAAELPRDTPIATVGGGALSIAPGTPMMIVDARDRLATITAQDVAASNGVVHVIDTVLLPAE
jgi:uncharacterized surface protein with fasciclin (FAS1) repeats